MIFDPEVHEFSGEVRRVRVGEWYWNGVCVASWEGVGETLTSYPIIVPRRRDIRWAWERMREGKTMRHVMGDYRVEGTVLMKRDGCDWSQAYMTRDLLDGWSEPASTAVGSLEWARGHVAKGGAVWLTNPLCKCTDERLVGAFGGWHPWGDREWLTALPDGTRVQLNPHQQRVKRCDSLYYLEGPLYSKIAEAFDSGWDLAREAERAKPSPIIDGWVASDEEVDPLDALAQDIADVSTQLAALAERVKRLEEQR